MLKLECPKCGQTLELDRGFAGGVCRCSHCGTLMKVPAVPADTQDQSASRPERPEFPAPAKRPRPAARPTQPPAIASIPPTTEPTAAVRPSTGSVTNREPQPPEPSSDKSRSGWKILALAVVLLAILLIVIAGGVSLLWVS